jgi:acyl-CoA hydrolase
VDPTWADIADPLISFSKGWKILGIKEFAMEQPNLPLTVGDSPLDEARPVTHSQQVMTHLTSPLDVNLHGTAFGGVILAAVDRIAYVSAVRHSDSQAVTASFDQVDFRSPIAIGEIVTLMASVNYVGRTSMEIGVRVMAESVAGGEPRHTNSCYVTMVAIDEAGKPKTVPKLILEDEIEYRRYRDALDRRKARLQLAEERRKRRVR